MTGSEFLQLLPYSRELLLYALVGLPFRDVHPLWTDGCGVAAEVGTVVDGGLKCCAPGVERFGGAILCLRGCP